MGNTTRIPLAALVMLLLAGACAATAERAASGASGEPAFQRVLERVGDDGRIDKDTALQAFALAFTPPPGVSRPPGPARPILSGSGPLRWVVGHLAELTPEQRRAVLAVVPRTAPRTGAGPGTFVLLDAGEQARF